MKSIKPFMTSILAFAAALTTRAQQPASSPLTGWYLQPSVAIGDFGSDFKTAVGPALAVGTTVAPRQQVEAEVIYLPSDFSGFSSSSLKFVPLLANYRLTVLSRQGLDWRVGASIGDTYERASYYYYHQTDNAFTGGINTDLSITIAKNVSLVFGIKVLRMGSSQFTTAGSYEVYQLGACYRF